MKLSIRKYWIGSAIVWALFSVHMLTKPGSGEPSWWMIFPEMDKVVHAIVFAWWAVLAYLSFESQSVVNGIIVAVLGVLLGASTEWLQTFVANRDGNVEDLLADTAGLMIAITFTFYVKKNQYRTK